MQSITKRLLAVISAVILMTTMLIPAFQASAASVKLNKTKIVLVVGQTYTLKVSGTKKTPQWSSSNKKIVSVTKKGVVKGLKKGTATITAKIGNKKYKCKVTVEAPKLSSTKKTVTAGTSFTLKLNGTKRAVKWYTSNKKIATVSSKGVVKTLKAGSVKITAKLGGKSYVCRLTVKAKPQKPQNPQNPQTAAPKTLSEIVGEYAQVYNATQKADSVTGRGFYEVLNFRNNGQENAALKGILSSVLSSFIEDDSMPLMPYTEDKKPVECLVTADDIKSAQYRDEKNSTATIRLVPKTVENPKMFSDPQGKMFNVPEDIFESLDNLAVVKWSKGTAKDNVRLVCGGGYAEVTYDKKTKLMKSADYVLDMSLHIENLNIAVLENQTFDLDMRYTVSYSNEKNPDTNQLVSEYNRLINNLKNEKGEVSVYKSSNTYFECTACSSPVLRNIWDGICKAFSGITEDEYRFKSGKRVNGFTPVTLSELIPPSNNSAALSGDAVASAKSVPVNGGGKRLTLVLRAESRTEDSPGGLKPSFAEKAVNPVNLFMYEFPKGIKAEDIRTVYDETTVEATQDADGKLVKLCIASSSQSSFNAKASGFSAAVSVDAAKDELYTVTYA